MFPQNREKKAQRTSSNVNIPRYDGSNLVLCQTGVDLSVNFLSVIFGAEWRKNEISIRQYLTQSWHLKNKRNLLISVFTFVVFLSHISNCCSVASYPDDFRWWWCIGAAFNNRSSGVWEVNSIVRFLDKNWAFHIFLTIRWCSDD